MTRRSWSSAFGSSTAPLLRSSLGLLPRLFRKEGEMHHPIRSEADAFRLVVIIGVGAGAVVVLALLTRPAAVAILAAALLGIGIGFAWRGARGSEPHLTEIAEAPRDGRHRILVVANQTVGGRALLEEIRN